MSWILLLLALQLVFKTSWTWPISTSWLATAGLGWAVVLVGSTRSGPLANTTLQASTANLAYWLRQGVQIDSAELKQVDQMMGEAMVELTTAVKGLREEGHDRRADAVQGAVIALQFRDVIGQKLGSVQPSHSEIDERRRSRVVLTKYGTPVQKGTFHG